MKLGETAVVSALILSGCATVTSDYTLHTLFRKTPGHADAFAGGAIGIRWAGNWIYVYGSPPCVRFRYPDGLRKDLGEKASQLAISPDGRRLLMRIWPWKREFRHVVYPLDKGGDIAGEPTTYRDPFEREENPGFVAWTNHSLPMYSLNSIPRRDRGMALRQWSLDGQLSEGFLRLDHTSEDIIANGPSGDLWLTIMETQSGRPYEGDRSFVVDSVGRWRQICVCTTWPHVRSRAISPDGELVAIEVSSFLTGSGGKGGLTRSPRDLWIARLRDTKLIKVAHSEAYVYSVTFSPDSRKLAIFAWQWATAGYKVVRMPANLVVVELEEALARLDAGLSAEEEAEAKLLVEKTKLKTWDLEHAPVMTLEQVRAFREGRKPEAREEE